MEATTCTCNHHRREHSLQPCGCPNDRPEAHPMHICNDAYHKVWCTVCIKWCHTDCASQSSCSQDPCSEETNRKGQFIKSYVVTDFSFSSYLLAWTANFKFLLLPHIPCSMDRVQNSETTANILILRPLRCNQTRSCASWYFIVDVVCLVRMCVG